MSFIGNYYGDLKWYDNEYHKVSVRQPYTVSMIKSLKRKFRWEYRLDVANRRMRLEIEQMKRGKLHNRFDTEEKLERFVRKNLSISIALTILRDTSSRSFTLSSNSLINRLLTEYELEILNKKDWVRFISPTQNKNSTYIYTYTKYVNNIRIYRAELEQLLAQF